MSATLKNGMHPNAGAAAAINSNRAVRRVMACVSRAKLKAGSPAVFGVRFQDGGRAGHVGADLRKFDP